MGSTGLLKLFNPLLGIIIIMRHRDLLWQLAWRGIALRYKGSVLGIFWSFVQPLMMLCVYTFVFSVIFQVRWGVDTGGDRAAFAIIMFCGMAVFNVFSESVNGSCGLITGNPGYVKKVVFPLEILPMAHIVSSSILSLVWFVLLFIGAVFILDGLSWTMLLLPITFLPLIFLACGVGLFVSSLTVYLRDIGHLIGVFMQMLFFMTPVFYPIQAVPEKYRLPLQLNPLTIIVEQTRNVFLYAKMPDWTLCGIGWLVSLFVFQMGLIWFLKTKKGFADVL